jgi:predicted nucleic acid-binding protein
MPESRGLTERVEPWIDKLEDAGLWVSAEVRKRILSLAGEREAPLP